VSLQNRFKAWFEKGGSSKKGKMIKMKSQKGLKRVTKTYASYVRNLSI
jgi:hypothetical protein